MLLQHQPRACVIVCVRAHPEPRARAAKCSCSARPTPAAAGRRMRPGESPLLPASTASSPLLDAGKTCRAQASSASNLVYYGEVGIFQHNFVCPLPPTTSMPGTVRRGKACSLRPWPARRAITSSSSVDGRREAVTDVGADRREPELRRTASAPPPVAAASVCARCEDRVRLG